MTSPHSGYPHSGHGPGPSSYYHPSQPPPHLYGSHSPGPAAPSYSYHGQYPPPPPQPSTPSRQNGRGGSYSTRNHNPYSYYPPQFTPQGPGVPLHAPNPHHHYSAKYNGHIHHNQGHVGHVHQPYSPTPYGYPNPAAMPFTPPPRHTPQPQPQPQAQTQPLSPLPKQPSMVPPQANGFYEGGPPVVHRQPSHPQQVPEQPVVPIPPAPPSVPVEEEPTVQPPPPPEVSVDIQSEDAPFSGVPDQEQSSSSVDEPQPSSPRLPPSSIPYEYDRMGTIETHDTAVPSSPTKPDSSPKPSAQTSVAVSNPVGSWAIWSRRPHDPSSAPGIIISPRARPPPSVVEQAIDAPTPPPSPPPEPRRSGAKQRKEPQVEEEEEKGAVADDGLSSSAVTETADESTVPHSPVSSHTSVSVSGATGKEEIVTTTEAQAEAEPAEPVQLNGDIKAEASTSSDAPPSEAKAEPGTVPASAQDAATPGPAHAPAPTPAAPPVKKSWASLLKPAASAESSSSSKNSLPTSSVVGFSIPASALASSDSPSGSSSSSTIGGVPVSPSKRTELLHLLTTPPSNAPYASKIKPRGLVNSGNMCFANSVLQTLVYCAPFNRLFMELGKVLPLGVDAALAKEKEKEVREGPRPGEVPVSSTSTPTTSSSTSGASSSKTPLVDATAAFLKEFVNERKVNAGVAAGYGRGKGKERVLDGDDDDWEMDSFLPTAIYDAMKEKKRFDTMRGGQQEDAEEFLGFYLDTLEEELLSLLNSISSSSSKPSVEEKEELVSSSGQQDDGWMEVGKKNRMAVTRTIKVTESPITRIFGGKFRSTLRAPRQKDSVVVEDWRSLRLDIQRDQIKTIQDALSYISHPQPVQLMLPTHPGVPVEATQQVLIESLPPILVLHIKRFCYDTTVKGVVKVGKQVTFGPELEIGPDLMAPSVKKSTGTRYKLFGALYHHGLSASGGHYTLDVLHPTRYPGSGSGTPGPNGTAAATVKAREGWIRVDDELVSDVRPEDVFGNQERDDSRCAYLLFYRRIW